MRFVHAADIHLDSPMRGLAAYPGAPVEAMRGATRSALRSLVDLCLDENADLLLIAGDVVDGDWPDYHTGLYMVSELRRLCEAEIPVVMIRGNHDAASVVTKALRWPEGVRLLSSSRPETVTFEDIGVAVHGQSFATRAVTDNLAAGYPSPQSGLVNIGLLHTCLGGYIGHENYAPCALDGLVSSGYDYWALGHIHQRAVLHEAPHVVFPGNTQGCHPRECGPKGATLVDVIDRAIQTEERTLDHVRWDVVRIDAGHLADSDQLLAQAQEQLTAAVAAADDRLVACRIEIGGVSPAHPRFVRDRDHLDAELRAIAGGLGAEALWVERVIWKTSPQRGANAGADDALGEVLKALREISGDEGTLSELAEELAPLTAKLPLNVREGPDGVDPSDPETLRSALADIEATLPPLLTEASR
jgi:exonuclease SbcD